jgi:Xaa-Pro aminopeptidase
VDHAGRRHRLLAGLEDLGTQAFLITRLPNVRYLTGFSGSNGQLILTAQDGVFLTDGRYAVQSGREVPGLTRQIYSGDMVPPIARTLAGLGLKRVAFESADMTYKTYSAFLSAGIELLPAADLVESLRWVKEPAEIACLDAAQSIADQAFEVITAKLVEGITEKQAALELDTTMRALGADGLAFDTIMAFGESSAEPHHSPTDRPLARGDIVKMDFGCVVTGYHSDMTRTVGFGEVASRLVDIYEIVRRAQEAGVRAVRAGVTGGGVDEVTRDIIGEAGYADAYRHGVGHGVGLEVHEGPSLRSGSGDVLPEGSVVTVEPGIYLDEVGGVRIEDMVEVKADGGRVIPATTKDFVVL